MQKGIITFVISVFSILAILPNTCFGIDAVSLRQMLERGDKVTVIDIRSRDLYLAGHIRGAINISANVIVRKPLPPVGMVVVCGDGVRSDITGKAVAALNERAGIQADFLEGGFAAWNAHYLPKSRKQGLIKQRLRYITYQELKKAAEKNRDMVLVDIRRFRKEKATESADTGVDVLSDLSAQFPGLEVITPEPSTLHSGAKRATVSITAMTKGRNGVYVLIDRGDGRAEDVARRLYAAGIRQALILIGGERVLQREGQPGTRTEVSGNSL